MKKISTLALALIAMGSLSMPASAQVNFEPVSTSTLESGWYQMRQVVGVTRTDISATAPRYVYSAETAKDGKYYFASDAAQKSDATAFVYVDNTDGKYAIKSINGKWGDFVAISSNTKPAYDIIQMDKNNPTQYRVGTSSYWEDWSNWNYIAGSRNSGNARFEFSKVGKTDLAAYDIYTLEITGATIANVSSTNAANKGTQTVYPGGNFFFTAGTSLTSSDFNAPDVTDYNKTITVDAANKKIVVAYQFTKELSELQATAKELLSHKGVGYPTESAAARTTLTTVAAGEDAVALYDAIKVYKRSTADIQMPEDGKAYRIKVPYLGDKVNYLYSSTSKVGNKAVTEANNDNVFVCRKVDNNYVFVTNNGTYFVWADSGDGEKSYSQSAQTPSYVEQNKWTVEAATLDKGSHGIMGVTDRADVFGYVQLKGHGKNNNNTYYLLAKYDDAFVSGDSNDKFYDANGGNPRSCFYQFEEVSYPNTVTFNAVSDVEGVSNLATFSAPFATVVPEGVTAYYVSTADNSKATMKAIEAGKAIPAKAGVILTSTTGDEATMIPATTETAAELTGNKLGYSAGAEKTIAEGDNAYILAKRDNATAFYKGKVGTKLGMNKAYLTLNVAGAEQAFSMNFGGNVTGINQIVNAEQNNAPVYDLTGRRVVRTVKGGLYIKGGNKFIAR
jgi:hypothetical protein